MTAVITPPLPTVVAVRPAREIIVHRLAVVAVILAAVRWLVFRHTHWFVLRHLPFGWVTWIVLLAVISMAVGYALSNRPSGADDGAISLSWLIAAAALFLAVAAPFNWVHKPKTEVLKREQCETVGREFLADAKPPECGGPLPPKVEAIPATTVPTGDGEWAPHLYRTDEGTPQGYFGLAVEECKPGVGTVEKCLQVIDKTLKGDNEILASKLRSFNLLDDFHGMSASEFDRKSPEEVEVLRQQAAEKLKDVNLRKQWQPRVMDQYRGLSGLKLVGLSGPMNSEYTDSTGVRHQIDKNMDPSVNYGLQGKRPDGSTYTDKADCHMQEVSNKPLKNVPVQETPVTTSPPVATTTPPVATTRPVATTQPVATTRPVATTQPPVTAPPTTAPPVTVKPCLKDGAGCGENGRDAPAVSASLTPQLQSATPGVTAGRFDTVEAQQQQAATQPVYTQTPAGVERPAGSSPGQTVTPTGPVNGTSAGANPALAPKTESSNQTTTVAVPEP